MSTSPTNPLPSFADAVTAAEQAITNSDNNKAQTAVDQTAAAAAQAKADSANGVVKTDLANQATVDGAKLAALQTLDAVLQAQIADLTAAGVVVPPASPTDPAPARGSGS